MNWIRAGISFPHPLEDWRFVADVDESTLGSNLPRFRMGQDQVERYVEAVGDPTWAVLEPDVLILKHDGGGREPDGETRILKDADGLYDFSRAGIPITVDPARTVTLADVDLMDGIIDIPNVRLQTYDGKVDWWNGFAPPLFTLAQVDRMVEQLNRWYAENPDTADLPCPFEIQRQGAVIIIVQENDWHGVDELDIKVYTPNEDGLYAVGSWDWTWSAENVREEVLA